MNVGQSGADRAIEEFCGGEIDAVASGRAIDPSEATLCSQGGVDAAPLQVANGAAAAIANPALGVRCLDRAQLRHLWGKGSSVSMLAELGDDANTGAPFAGAELSLYGPASDSDGAAFFSQAVTGEPGGGRSDYLSGGDDAVVERVGADDGGIGFVEFSSYAGNEDAVGLLGVDGGSGCVTPSIETIQDGSYPLARPLLVYASREALAKKPVLAEFLRFIEDNQDAIAADAGTVAMTPRQAAKSEAGPPGVAWAGYLTGEVG